MAREDSVNLRVSGVQVGQHQVHPFRQPDPARVRAVLRRAAAGLNTPWGSLVSLLAVEVWLRTIETTSPVEWSHDPREPMSS